MVHAQPPRVATGLRDSYATLWFTTPFLATSFVATIAAIIPVRRTPQAQYRPLPPYPSAKPSLVLGEIHHEMLSGRAAHPHWLTIPQRGGLYTGIMVLGAVGTGKTSACMYPYVDQLLRWSSQDQERKIGGLVLEAKGHFCGQVRGVLQRAGRADDYVEIGLDSGICYNRCRTT